MHFALGRNAGICSIGQWRRLRGQGTDAEVEEDRNGRAVHRARESLGESLLRKMRDECLNEEIFCPLLPRHLRRQQI